MSPDLPTLISLAHLWVTRLPHDTVMWDFAWHFFYKEDREDRHSPGAAYVVGSSIVILATAAYQAILERPMTGYIQQWAHPYGCFGGQRAAGEHLVDIVTEWV
ncbi:hypothetical protein BST61_g2639 [Cercospora zeina]